MPYCINYKKIILYVKVDFENINHFLILIHISLIKSINKNNGIDYGLQ